MFGSGKFPHSVHLSPESHNFNTLHFASGRLADSIGKDGCDVCKGVISADDLQLPEHCAGNRPLAWAELEGAITQNRVLRCQNTLRRIIGQEEDKGQGLDDSPPPDQTLPRIAVLFSGGGWRAMLGTLVVLDALATPLHPVQLKGYGDGTEEMEGKLLDSISHIFGLSGSSWVLYSLFVKSMYNGNGSDNKKGKNSQKKTQKKSKKSDKGTEDGKPLENVSDGQISNEKPHSSYENETDWEEQLDNELDPSEAISQDKNNLSYHFSASSVEKRLRFRWNIRHDKLLRKMRAKRNRRRAHNTKPVVDSHVMVDSWLHGSDHYYDPCAHDEYGFAASGGTNSKEPSVSDMVANYPEIIKQFYLGSSSMGTHNASEGSVQYEGRHFKAGLNSALFAPFFPAPEGEHVTDLLKGPSLSSLPLKTFMSVDGFLSTRCHHRHTNREGVIVPASGHYYQEFINFVHPLLSAVNSYRHCNELYIFRATSLFRPPLTGISNNDTAVDTILREMESRFGYGTSLRPTIAAKDAKKKERISVTKETVVGKKKVAGKYSLERERLRLFLESYASLSLSARFARSSSSFSTNEDVIVSSPAFPRHIYLQLFDSAVTTAESKLETLRSSEVQRKGSASSECSSGINEASASVGSTDCSPSISGTLSVSRDEYSILDAQTGLVVDAFRPPFALDVIAGFNNAVIPHIAQGTHHLTLNDDVNSFTLATLCSAARKYFSTPHPATTATSPFLSLSDSNDPILTLIKATSYFDRMHPMDVLHAFQNNIMFSESNSDFADVDINYNQLRHSSVDRAVKRAAKSVTHQQSISKALLMGTDIFSFGLITHPYIGSCWSERWANYLGNSLLSSFTGFTETAHINSLPVSLIVRAAHSAVSGDSNKDLNETLVSIFAKMFKDDDTMPVNTETCKKGDADFVCEALEHWLKNIGESSLKERLGQFSSDSRLSALVLALRETLFGSQRALTSARHSVHDMSTSSAEESDVTTAFASDELIEAEAPPLTEGIVWGPNTIGLRSKLHENNGWDAGRIRVPTLMPSDAINLLPDITFVKPYNPNIKDIYGKSKIALPKCLECHEMVTPSSPKPSLSTECSNSNIMDKSINVHFKTTGILSTKEKQIDDSRIAREIAMIMSTAVPQSIIYNSKGQARASVTPLAARVAPLSGILLSPQDILRRKNQKHTYIFINCAKARPRGCILLSEYTRKPSKIISSDEDLLHCEFPAALLSGSSAADVQSRSLQKIKAEFLRNLDPNMDHCSRHILLSTGAPEEKATFDRRCHEGSFLANLYSDVKNEHIDKEDETEPWSPLSVNCRDSERSLNSLLRQCRYNKSVAFIIKECKNKAKLRKLQRRIKLRSRKIANELFKENVSSSSNNDMISNSSSDESSKSSSSSGSESDENENEMTAAQLMYRGDLPFLVSTAVTNRNCIVDYVWKTNKDRVSKLEKQIDAARTNRSDSCLKEISDVGTDMSSSSELQRMNTLTTSTDLSVSEQSEQKSVSSPKSRTAARQRAKNKSDITQLFPECLHVTNTEIFQAERRYDFFEICPFFIYNRTTNLFSVAVDDLIVSYTMRTEPDVNDQKIPDMLPTSAWAQSVKDTITNDNLFTIPAYVRVHNMEVMGPTSSADINKSLDVPPVPLIVGTNALATHGYSFTPFPLDRMRMHNFMSVSSSAFSFDISSVLLDPLMQKKLSTALLANDPGASAEIKGEDEFSSEKFGSRDDTVTGFISSLFSAKDLESTAVRDFAPAVHSDDVSDKAPSTVGEELSPMENAFGATVAHTNFSFTFKGEEENATNSTSWSDRLFNFVIGPRLTGSKDIYDTAGVAASKAEFIAMLATVKANIEARYFSTQVSARKEFTEPECLVPHQVAVVDEQWMEAGNSPILTQGALEMFARPACANSLLLAMRNPKSEQIINSLVNAGTECERLDSKRVKMLLRDVAAGSEDGPYTLTESITSHEMNKGNLKKCNLENDNKTRGNDLYRFVHRGVPQNPLSVGYHRVGKGCRDAGIDINIPFPPALGAVNSRTGSGSTTLTQGIQPSLQDFHTPFTNNSVKQNDVAQLISRPNPAISDDYIRFFTGLSSKAALRTLSLETAGQVVAPQVKSDVASLESELLHSDLKLQQNVSLSRFFDILVVIDNGGGSTGAEKIQAALERGYLQIKSELPRNFGRDKRERQAAMTDRCIMHGRRSYVATSSRRRPPSMAALHESMKHRRDLTHSNLYDEGDTNYNTTVMRELLRNSTRGLTRDKNCLKRYFKERNFVRNANPAKNYRSVLQGKTNGDDFFAKIEHLMARKIAEKNKKNKNANEEIASAISTNSVFVTKRTSKEEKTGGKHNSGFPSTGATGTFDQQRLGEISLTFNRNGSSLIPSNNVNDLFGVDFNEAHLRSDSEDEREETTINCYSSFFSTNPVAPFFISPREALNEVRAVNKHNHRDHMLSRMLLEDQKKVLSSLGYEKDLVPSANLPKYPDSSLWTPCAQFLDDSLFKTKRPYRDGAHFNYNHLYNYRKTLFPGLAIARRRLRRALVSQLHVPGLGHVGCPSQRIEKCANECARCRAIAESHYAAVLRSRKVHLSAPCDDLSKRLGHQHNIDESLVNHLKGLGERVRIYRGFRYDDEDIVVNVMQNEGTEFQAKIENADTFQGENDTYGKKYPNTNKNTDEFTNGTEGVTLDNFLSRLSPLEETESEDSSRVFLCRRRRRRPVTIVYMLGLTELDTNNSHLYFDPDVAGMSERIDRSALVNLYRMYAATMRTEASLNKPKNNISNTAPTNDVSGISFGTFENEEQFLNTQISNLFPRTVPLPIHQYIIKSTYARAAVQLLPAVLQEIRLFSVIKRSLAHSSNMTKLAELKTFGTLQGLGKRLFKCPVIANVSNEGAGTPVSGTSEYIIMQPAASDVFVDVASDVLSGSLSESSGAVSALECTFADRIHGALCQEEETIRSTSLSREPRALSQFQSALKALCGFGAARAVSLPPVSSYQDIAFPLVVPASRKPTPKLSPQLFSTMASHTCKLLRSVSRIGVFDDEQDADEEGAMLQAEDADTFEEITEEVEEDERTSVEVETEVCEDVSPIESPAKQRNEKHITFNTDVQDESSSNSLSDSVTALFSNEELSNSNLRNTGPEVMLKLKEMSSARETIIRYYTDYYNSFYFHSRYGSAIPNYNTPQRNVVYELFSEMLSRQLDAALRHEERKNDLLQFGVTSMGKRDVEKDEQLNASPAAAKNSYTGNFVPPALYLFEFFCTIEKQMLSLIPPLVRSAVVVMLQQCAIISSTRLGEAKTFSLARGKVSKVGDHASAHISIDATCSCMSRAEDIHNMKRNQVCLGRKGGNKTRSNALVNLCPLPPRIVPENTCLENHSKAAKRVLPSHITEAIALRLSELQSDNEELLSIVSDDDSDSSFSDFNEIEQLVDTSSDESPEQPSSPTLPRPMPTTGFSRTSPLKSSSLCAKSALQLNENSCIYKSDALFYKYFYDDYNCSLRKHLLRTCRCENCVANLELINSYVKFHVDREAEKLTRAPNQKEEKRASSTIRHHEAALSGTSDEVNPNGLITIVVGKPTPLSASAFFPCLTLRRMNVMYKSYYKYCAPIPSVIDMRNCIILTEILSKFDSATTESSKQHSFNPYTQIDLCNFPDVLEILLDLGIITVAPSLKTREAIERISTLQGAIYKLVCRINEKINVLHELLDPTSGKDINEAHMETILHLQKEKRQLKRLRMQHRRMVIRLKTLPRRHRRPNAPNSDTPLERKMASIKDAMNAGGRGKDQYFASKIFFNKSTSVKPHTRRRSLLGFKSSERRFSPTTKQSLDHAHKNTVWRRRVEKLFCYESLRESENENTPRSASSIRRRNKEKNISGGFNCIPLRYRYHYRFLNSKTPEDKRTDILLLLLSGRLYISPVWVAYYTTISLLPFFCPLRATQALPPLKKSSSAQTEKQMTAQIFPMDCTIADVTAILAHFNRDSAFLNPPTNNKLPERIPLIVIATGSGENGNEWMNSPLQELGLAQTSEFYGFLTIMLTKIWNLYACRYSIKGYLQEKLHFSKQLRASPEKRKYSLSRVPTMGTFLPISFSMLISDWISNDISKVAANVGKKKLRMTLDVARERVMKSINKTSQNLTDAHAPSEFVRNKAESNNELSAILFEAPNRRPKLSKKMNISAAVDEITWTSKIGGHSEKKMQDPAFLLFSGKESTVSKKSTNLGKMKITEKSSIIRPFASAFNENNKLVSSALNSGNKQNENYDNSWIDIDDALTIPSSIATAVDISDSVEEYMSYIAVPTIARSFELFTYWALLSSEDPLGPCTAQGGEFNASQKSKLGSTLAKLILTNMSNEGETYSCEVKEVEKFAAEVFTYEKYPVFNSPIFSFVKELITNNIYQEKAINRDINFNKMSDSFSFFFQKNIDIFGLLNPVTAPHSDLPLSEHSAASSCALLCPLHLPALCTVAIERITLYLLSRLSVNLVDGGNMYETGVGVNFKAAQGQHEAKKDTDAIKDTEAQKDDMFILDYLSKRLLAAVGGRGELTDQKLKKRGASAVVSFTTRSRRTSDQKIEKRVSDSSRGIKKRRSFEAHFFGKLRTPSVDNTRSKSKTKRKNLKASSQRIKESIQHGSVDSSRGKTTSFQPNESGGERHSIPYVCPKCDEQVCTCSDRKYNFPSLNEFMQENNSAAATDGDSTAFGGSFSTEIIKEGFFTPSVNLTQLENISNEVTNDIQEPPLFSEGSIHISNNGNVMLPLPAKLKHPLKKYRRNAGVDDAESDRGSSLSGSEFGKIVHGDSFSETENVLENTQHCSADLEDKSVATSVLSGVSICVLFIQALICYKPSIARLVPKTPPISTLLPQSFAEENADHPTDSVPSSIEIASILAPLTFFLMIFRFSLSAQTPKFTNEASFSSALSCMKSAGCTEALSTALSAVPWMFAAVDGTLNQALRTFISFKYKALVHTVLDNIPANETAAALLAKQIKKFQDGERCLSDNLIGECSLIMHFVQCRAVLSSQRAMDTATFFCDPTNQWGRRKHYIYGADINGNSNKLQDHSLMRTGGAGSTPARAIEKAVAELEKSVSIVWTCSSLYAIPGIPTPPSGVDSSYLSAESFSCSSCNIPTRTDTSWALFYNTIYKYLAICSSLIHMFIDTESYGRQVCGSTLDISSGLLYELAISLRIYNARVKKGVQEREHSKRFIESELNMVAELARRSDNFLGDKKHLIEAVISNITQNPQWNHVLHETQEFHHLESWEVLNKKLKSNIDETGISSRGFLLSKNSKTRDLLRLNFQIYPIIKALNLRTWIPANLHMSNTRFVAELESHLARVFSAAYPSLIDSLDEELLNSELTYIDSSQPHKRAQSTQSFDLDYTLSASQFITTNKHPNQKLYSVTPGCIQQSVIDNRLIENVTERLCSVVQEGIRSELIVWTNNLNEGFEKSLYNASKADIEKIGLRTENGDNHQRFMNALIELLIDRLRESCQKKGGTVNEHLINDYRNIFYSIYAKHYDIKAKTVLLTQSQSSDAITSCSRSPSPEVKAGEEAVLPIVSIMEDSSSGVKIREEPLSFIEKYKRLVGAEDAVQYNKSNHNGTNPNAFKIIALETSSLARPDSNNSHIFNYFSAAKYCCGGALAVTGICADDVYIDVISVIKFAKDWVALHKLPNDGQHNDRASKTLRWLDVERGIGSLPISAIYSSPLLSRIANGDLDAGVLLQLWLARMWRDDEANNDNFQESSAWESTTSFVIEELLPVVLEKYYKVAKLANLKAPMGGNMSAFFELNKDKDLSDGIASCKLFELCVTTKDCREALMTASGVRTATVRIRPRQSSVEAAALIVAAIVGAVEFLEETEPEDKELGCDIDVEKENIAEKSFHKRSIPILPQPSTVALIINGNGSKQIFQKKINTNSTDIPVDCLHTAGRFALRAKQDVFSLYRTYLVAGRMRQRQLEALLVVLHQLDVIDGCYNRDRLLVSTALEEADAVLSHASNFHESILEPVKNIKQELKKLLQELDNRLLHSAHTRDVVHSGCESLIYRIELKR